MILDSNIVIYAAAPEGEPIRELIARESPSVSAISLVEVLGFHRLQEHERTYLEAFFKITEQHPLDPPVLQQAVVLRQQRKMGLGDALIAATALVQHDTLVTRNTADFAWVPGLQLLDPYANDQRRTTNDE